MPILILATNKPLSTQRIEFIALYICIFHFHMTHCKWPFNVWYVNDLLQSLQPPKPIHRCSDNHQPIWAKLWCMMRLLRTNCEYCEADAPGGKILDEHLQIYIKKSCAITRIKLLKVSPGHCSQCFTAGLLKLSSK